MITGYHIIYKSLILGISFEKLDTILDLHFDDMIRIFGETRYSEYSSIYYDS